MNRGKRSLNNKVQKKVRKMVRREQNLPVTPEEKGALPQIVISQRMNRPPVEDAKRDKQLDQMAAKRALLEKKTKKPKKVSKRTTPGLVDSRLAAPKVVHQEGKRWIQTVNKQIRSENKVIRKRASKK